MAISGGPKERCDGVRDDAGNADQLKAFTLSLWGSETRPWAQDRELLGRGDSRMMWRMGL